MQIQRSIWCSTIPHQCGNTVELSWDSRMCPAKLKTDISRYATNETLEVIVAIVIIIIHHHHHPPPNLPKVHFRPQLGFCRGSGGTTDHSLNPTRQRSFTQWTVCCYPPPGFAYCTDWHTSLNLRNCPIKVSKAVDYKVKWSIVH